MSSWKLCGLSRGENGALSVWILLLGGLTLRLTTLGESAALSVFAVVAAAAAAAAAEGPTIFVIFERTLEEVPASLFDVSLEDSGASGLPLSAFGKKISFSGSDGWRFHGYSGGLLGDEG